MNSWVIYAIGFTAQLLFSSRQLLQWIVSERHKRILTPALFWEISLFASFLLFVYGYLRHDFAIMLGQTITYYIYIRNLQLQGEWRKLHWILRGFTLFFPLIIGVYSYHNGIRDLDNLFGNDKIPMWLFVLGIASQILFTLRFVYQWLYSEKAGQSSLPMGFWIISFSGALLILVYAIFRRDPVLFVGHLMGIAIYSRSIIIKKNEHVRA